MATLPESNSYDTGIYQIETSDPVLGGPGGIANSQAQSLANRTKYLKAILDALVAGTTVPTGIATQAFVQSALNMLDAKQSVRAATTANITLTGVQTIDGVSVVAGDRVLVKNQTTASQNGIYVVSASGWTRAADFDENADVTPGASAYVEEGALQARSRWQLTTPAPVTVGTSNLVFGDITAGYAPLASPAFTGTPTAPKAAQFATGGQLINADALRANGLQYSGVRSIALSAATVNLTAADAGSLCVITGSGGGTLNLPAANSVVAGATITVRAGNTSVSTNTLKASGTDTLAGQLQSTSPAGVMRSGDTIVATSDGSSVWHLSSDTSYNFVSQAVAQLFSSGQLISNAGYVRLPGGFIFQWFAVSSLAATGTGGAAYTLPMAFPNGKLFAVAGLGSNAGNGNSQFVGTNVVPGTNGQIYLYAGGSASVNCYCFVIGW